LDFEKLNKILKDKRFIFGLLVLGTAVSRLFIINGNYSIYSWDAGNFALAVDSFSLEDGRPHLPGYYLHIQLISFLTSITNDKFISMNLFSILYSALAAGFIFLISRRWFTLIESILLTLLIMTNPLVWYYGSVAEIYSFDIFASVLLVWMGLSPYALVVTPALMGLILGIRPSTGIFLLPLYIYFWQKHFRNGSISLKATFFYHAPALIILLSWLAPLLIRSGGIDNYLQLYSTSNPVENITVLQSMFRFSSYLITILPIVLVFYIAAMVRRNRAQKLFDILNEDFEDNQLFFLHWWLWPSLIFFIFVHYSKGYILINIIPIYILSLLLLKDVRLRKIISVTLIIVQIVYFCFVPYHNPNTQIYISSVQRKISAIQVWFERTTSEYFMGREHIVALQDCHDLIAETAEDVVMLVGDKQYLFFDPTVIVSPRAVQAHYPQMEITKYLPSFANQYGYHHERIQEARSGFSSMLTQSMIISRLDFIEEYLSDIKIELFKKDKNWGIFFVSAEEAPKLSARYSQLFGRN